ncbi:MAG: class I SAM-dependent methyltransferase [Streptosporangiales bacterium]|nr:class I SAM-dependent methyltransferase [Streptosporangiales bacterium]
MSGSSPELAATFKYAGVADAYRHRPPYPDEVFEVLESLVTDEPRAVLDVGAGEGALARPLALRVDRVDAVDVSAAMVEAGRRRPGGDRDNLRWLVAAVEECDLPGPYALVTAGASLHWMSWRPTMTRLAAAMTSRAQLAIVEHGPRDEPWHGELVTVIRRHSRSPRFDARFSLPDGLADAGCFRQSVADYVEQFHSTSSLAREPMGDEAAAFDRAVTDPVTPYTLGGVLAMDVVATVAWAAPWHDLTVGDSA